MEKETNSDLTENWVAYANLPSKFPNFPKFFSALKFFQLYRIFVVCLKNPHEEKISRRKTSLNCDVRRNFDFFLIVQIIFLTEKITTTMDSNTAKISLRNFILFAKEKSELRNGFSLCTQFSSLLLFFPKNY